MLYSVKSFCILSIHGFLRNCKRIFQISLVPFCLFPIKGLDGPADFIEHPHGYHAGGIAQVVEDGGGGKLGDAQQILVLQILGGVQTAAGENGILDAGGEHIPKAHLQVEIVQLLQQTVAHIVGQVGQVITVDLVHRSRGQLHQPPADVPAFRGTVSALQRIRHSGVVLLPHFP